MRENRNCPTPNCNTLVQCQYVVSGDNYQYRWDCPNCAWELEINTSEED